MKLYYWPKTRATRSRWMLEELGVPYDLVRIDLTKNEQKSPEFLKINPNGAVPALQDGNQNLFESAAICAYLADKFPEKKLAPAANSPDRGPYYQWLFYSMATLDTNIVMYMLHSQRLPEAQRSAYVAEEAKKASLKGLAVVNDAVKGKEFLVGNHFTAADVMIGSAVSFAGYFGLVSDFPAAAEYAKKLTARPAYQRAIKD